MRVAVVAVCVRVAHFRLTIPDTRQLSSLAVIALARTAAVAGLVALLGLVAAAPAYADGDPASDVLLFQDLFLPYNQPSTDVGASLNGVVKAANEAGYPIKVAVIQLPADLGSVTALWGKPQLYAKFLEQELSLKSGRRLLVVMPAGYGVASGGETTIKTVNGVANISRKHDPIKRELGVIATLPPPSGSSPDQLTATAENAVRELSKAAGHPLPHNVAPVPVGATTGVHNGPTSGGPAASGSQGTSTTALVGGGLIGLAVVLALAAAWYGLRSRRR